MKTMQLIYYIATHPEIKVVVICDQDDKTPMQAIEYLSGNPQQFERWQINSTIEPGTLLVYMR